MVNQYTLDDYATIQTTGFDYKLPAVVHTIVQKLIAELGVAAAEAAAAAAMFPVIETSQQHSRYHASTNDRHSKIKKPRGDRSSRKPLDTLWEKQPEFIVTKIEKKEGIEKLINDIRVSLNKISTKNYDTHRDNIIKNIDDITKDEDPEQTDVIEKIAAAIFDIASTNKFYSELYAKLYQELTTKHPIFGKIIDTFIATTYVDSISLIEQVDETKDYEKYCIKNKENDKRKAMSVFIVNLMKHELIPRKKVADIILNLQSLVMQYIDEDNRTYNVEEITENIFLLLTTCQKDLMEDDMWKNITDNIQTCSQYKVKEHQSISSRAVFKYKDIVDFLRKL